MLSKLSINNIKKSIKDYSIYFFTLIFAVSMFYMFNSLDAQNSMLHLNKSKMEIAAALVMILNYVSVFVSVILGFLIVYSNNFLIKRRKKEIGLYLTLGMSKRKVSTILVIETIIIGIISLIIGLICGIGLSQFISIFTAKLFEVDMNKFAFIFSTSALYKTIVYFGIIFILVMLFNIITLSRYKLIDLLTASRKNEKIKMRNKYLTFITFIISICLIGYAYSLLFDDALVVMNSKTLIMLICGALGTLLFFYSLAGFLLKIVEMLKPLYLKDLNMFTLKQINSKINTTVISNTVISLMLLLTIGILSGSMSMAQAFNNDLKENNLTDFTIRTNESYQMDENGDYIKLESYNLNDLVKDDNFKNVVKNYVILNKYVDQNITIEKLLTKQDIDELKKEYGDMLSLDGNVNIISESDYIELMKLFNEENKIFDISDDQYLILCNVDFIIDHYKNAYQNKTGIVIDNKKLLPATDKIVNTAIENYNAAGNEGLIVVTDEVAKNLELSTTLMVGNYISNMDIDNLDETFMKYIYDESEGNLSIRTKLTMEASSVGFKAIVTFIGLYLGITFAISSATVLAIGQLSESSDNKDRFRVIRQIGADNKMIKKALFVQIAIAFMLPLLVGLFHSFFGLKELNSIIGIMANIDLTTNIIFTTLFILIVYGGYFIITYLCSKNIIKENN
ncbi:MAG: FtsX-like permease family protein [Bacilli bacterium]|nr:FtsX-like permease family protein [Bacilli bacterium]